MRLNNLKKSNCLLSINTGQLHVELKWNLHKNWLEVCLSNSAIAYYCDCLTRHRVDCYLRRDIVYFFIWQAIRSIVSWFIVSLECALDTRITVLSSSNAASWVLWGLCMTLTLHGVMKCPTENVNQQKMNRGQGDSTICTGSYFRSVPTGPTCKA